MIKKFSRQLFRIKDISTIMAESHDPAKRLKKVLGAFDLVLLGIGAIIGAIVATFAALTNIDEMVDLTNIGTLFAFVLVSFGIIILRVRNPHRPRSFRVPFSPVTPLLGVAACIFLMTGLPAITWLRFVVWLLVGLVVYFSYSMRHSLLHKR